MARRLPLWVLAVLALVAVGRALAVAPTLPDPLASHFDANGRADGCSSQRSFFVLGGVVLAGLVLLAAGLPALVRTLPTSLVNLPRREYWLAPERRAATVATLGAWMAWFGVATLGPLLGVFELVYAANRGAEGTPHLSGTIWVLLVGYLGFTGLWLLGFWLRFRRVPT